jgi:GNAT superfamily N-acetyltransferase
MKIESLSSLSDVHKNIIFKLWNQEYPTKLGFSNLSQLECYLAKLIAPQHYFAIINDERIAWAVTFERDNAIWFAIILDKKYHGKGYGKALLDFLQSKEAHLNGWVIDHQNDCISDGSVYKSPLGFYEKNGFVVCSDVRMENEIISAVKITTKCCGL